MTKRCPFNLAECVPDCALFISADELNESVVNRLSSIGVFSKGGNCSLKNIALSSMRKIFENTNVKRF